MEAQEDPSKVLGPGQASQAGLQGILPLAEGPLDDPVCLGVVGGGDQVGNAQLTADVTPTAWM